jgi:hypothetical protein
VVLEADIGECDEMNLGERPRPMYDRLNVLLAGVTKVNRHAPVDFCAPVGQEAW